MVLSSKSQPPCGNGWIMMTLVVSFLLLTTATTALSQQEINDEEMLPMTSSVMFEQYDRGTLYKTHFEAPYNEHLCQPHKIHLSPSSDIDPSSGLYNATVSFTLNLNNAVTKEGIGADGVRTTVSYGRGDSEEGSVVIHYENDDVIESQRKWITDDYTLIRFNYTSPTTGEYYQSDLIHHVLLKDLEAGKQRYWYNIQVEYVQKGFLVPAGVSPQPFFPPLMQPIENSYALTYPLATQYFLRGSYHAEKSRKLGQMRRRQQEMTVVLLGETPLYEFTTPPLYGNPTAIALVGDLGQTKNSTRTMARILGAASAGSYEKSTITTIVDNNNNEEDDDRLVTNLFIAGDLSYADGNPKRWESWLDLAEPLLREVPFVSIPGNHEIECDKETHDVFVPYESFFKNPNRIGEAIEFPPSQDYIDALHGWCTTPSEFMGRYDYGNSYFSYKQGLVHTIFLNSYASLIDGSKQREWLMNTALPEVDRELTPWLVVIFHTPLYTTFSSHYGELNPKVMMASGIREVFERYEVNLVVSGHDHAYMRTKPLDANGMVGDEGTIFWILGAGGNREGHSNYKHKEQENWVDKRNNDEFGFGLFFAPNATHAHLQWMRDDDNDVMSTSPGNSSLVMRDSVWIENRYQQGTVPW